MSEVPELRAAVRASAERRYGRRVRRRGHSLLMAIPAVGAVAVALLLARPEPDVERPAPSPASTPSPTPTGRSVRPRPGYTPPAEGTWTPRVGRPEVGLKATIDRSPVDAAAVDALAILQRPQTARDRRLAGPKLRFAGGGADGVQVDGVRALGPHYALVPVSRASGGTGAGTVASLCIVGSGGAGCGPVHRVSQQGVLLFSGGTQGTHIVGVVPDGVARVRFTPSGSSPVEVPVQENFFDLRVAATGPAGRVSPPSGWKGKVGADGRIVAPPTPAQGALDWLDASGRVVGPTR
jgi:hypothetical protein